MPSLWRRTMLYLGLGPDDDYDQAVSRPPVAARPERSSAAENPGPSAPGDDVGAEEAVRTISREAAEAAGARVAVRPVPTPRPTVVTRPTEPEAPAARAEPSAPEVTGQAAVRTIPMRARPHVVSPRSFNDAQQVADEFKLGRIVVMDQRDADRELARRLIDFASGLCYGLGGHMEKVAKQVYLLSPVDAVLSDTDRQRLRDQGLYE